MMKPEETPNDTLNSLELAFLIKLLDVVASRGAFKPIEYKDIGLVYERLLVLQKFAAEAETEDNEMQLPTTEDD